MGDRIGEAASGDFGIDTAIAPPFASPSSLIDGMIGEGAAEIDDGEIGLLACEDFFMINTFFATFDGLSGDETATDGVDNAPSVGIDGWLLAGELVGIWSTIAVTKCRRADRAGQV